MNVHVASRPESREEDVLVFTFRGVHPQQSRRQMPSPSVGRQFLRPSLVTHGKGLKWFQNTSWRRFGLARRLFAHTGTRSGSL